MVMGLLREILHLIEGHLLMNHTYYLMIILMLHSTLCAMEDDIFENFKSPAPAYYHPLIGTKRGHDDLFDDPAWTSVSDFDADDEKSFDSIQLTQPNIVSTPDEQPAVLAPMITGDMQKLSCSICGFSCKGAINLRTHFKECHNDIPGLCEIVESIPLRVRSRYDYKCPVLSCRKIFPGRTTTVSVICQHVGDTHLHDLYNKHNNRSHDHKRSRPSDSDDEIVIRDKTSLVIVSRFNKPVVPNAARPKFSCCVCKGLSYQLPKDLHGHLVSVHHDIPGFSNIIRNAPTKIDNDGEYRCPAAGCTRIFSGDVTTLGLIYQHISDIHLLGLYKNYTRTLSSSHDKKPATIPQWLIDIYTDACATIRKQSHKRVDQLKPEVIQQAMITVINRKRQAS